jgi:hypothetical protein
VASATQKKRKAKADRRNVAIMTVCADVENDTEEVQRQLKSVVLVLFTFLVP